MCVGETGQEEKEEKNPKNNNDEPARRRLRFGKQTCCAPRPAAESKQITSRIIILSFGLLGACNIGHISHARRNHMYIIFTGMTAAAGSAAGVCVPAAFPPPFRPYKRPNTFLLLARTQRITIHTVHVRSALPRRRRERFPRPFFSSSFYNVLREV